MSCDIEKLTKQIIQFRDDRDWEQFHNLKDLATGLSIEASELLELFLWKSNEEIEDYISHPENLLRVKEELADIFVFVLLINHKLNLDLNEIVLDKIQKNAKKYPVETCKGSSKKYCE